MPAAAAVMALWKVDIMASSLPAFPWADISVAYSAVSGCSTALPC